MPTYRYRIADFTPVATATDVLTITGCANKTIQISQISIGGDATAASLYDIYLIKRVTANTGGTATNPAGVPSSSKNEPHQATITLYTGNPSGLGTGLNLDGDHIFLPAAATPVYAAPVEYNWGVRGDEKPTLNGANESFCINFGGNAVPSGASLYLSIEWQEV